MYHVGRTAADKDEADQTFYRNMTLVIHNKSRWGFMKRLRMKAAKKFLCAVQLYGGSFFNAGKSILKVFDIREIHDSKEVQDT